jgi:rhodanese-related sulfurtransferase
MSKVFKFLVASIIAVFAMGSLSSCSSAEPLDMSSVAAVIDVRTPEEFVTGYLEGAVNYNIEGPEFEAQMAALDKSANYVIYCRSGNRAGQAISYMQSNGFTGTLTNAGSVADASSTTGLPIVQ